VSTGAVVAARTAGWEDAERATLQAVIDALRPSPRHLNDILDWLDDIAARDGTRPAAALAAPELQAILRARGAASDRLKRWKERLKRLRYPRLAARETTVADHLRALDLGPTITVTPPPGLEGDVVTVAIQARSTAELDAAISRLRDRIARGDIDRLFTLLDEA
jgi:hypothetical protein